MAHVASVKKEEADQHQADEWHIHHLVKDVDLTSVEIVLTTLSFIYGWAVLDAFDDIYFLLMLDCQSPGVCSFQSNFAFALLNSFIFSKVCAFLTRVRDYMDGKQKVVSSLQINAFTLTVGWTWTNFLVALDNFKKTTGATESVAQKILMNCVMWVVVASSSCLLYHFHSTLLRARKREQEAMLARSNSGTKNGNDGTVSTTGTVTCSTVSSKT
jgi:hypothetical protein